MASTLTSLNIHFVFSTKNREKIITEQVRSRLHQYMGGIARKNSMVAHEIGGTKDHIHLLISIPASISPAKAMQLIKGGSSKWMSDEFPEIGRFAWQQGYAAFSVSPSMMNKTLNYIRSQEEHHRKMTFSEEYLSFLKKSGIAYDERYVME